MIRLVAKESIHQMNVWSVGSRRANLRGQQEGLQFHWFRGEQGGNWKTWKHPKCHSLCQHDEEDFISALASVSAVEVKGSCHAFAVTKPTEATRMMPTDTLDHRLSNLTKHNSLK